MGGWRVLPRRLRRTRHRGGRSSFHSTLNSLSGLLAHEIATGGTDATRAARYTGQEYLLRAARSADGTWVQAGRQPGRTWFEVDVPAGQPSKWLTLFGTRVVDW